MMAPKIHPPSMRVVAKHAGVSKPTVAKILGGESHLFAEATRQKVLDAAKAVGYTRVPAAVRDSIIQRCVIIVAPRPSPKISRFHVTGSHQYVNLSAIEALQRRSIHVLTIEDRACDEKMVQQIIRSRPLGLVVPDFPILTDDDLARIANAKIPVVALGGGSHFQGFDRVVSDHEGGSYALTKWVLAQGARRPIEFWPEDARNKYWLHDRHRGYERAMREAGLEPNESVYFAKQADFMRNIGEFDKGARIAAGYLVDRLLGESPVDWLLTINDGETALTARALRLCGRVPNKDVMIAGYDCYWPHVEYRQWENVGPLVTVDKHNDLIGAELVSLLMDRIEGKLPDAPQTRLVPSEVLDIHEVERRHPDPGIVVPSNAEQDSVPVGENKAG
jgi:DNA-binding LacI/PurR family transcriptional regulator